MLYYKCMVTVNAISYYLRVTHTTLIINARSGSEIVSVSLNHLP